MILIRWMITAHLPNYVFCQTFGSRNSKKFRCQIFFTQNFPRSLIKKTIPAKFSINIHISIFCFPNVWRKKENEVIYNTYDLIFKTYLFQLPTLYNFWSNLVSSSYSQFNFDHRKENIKCINSYYERGKKLNGKEG